MILVEIGESCTSLQELQKNFLNNHRIVSILLIFIEIFESILTDLKFSLPKQRISIDQHSFLKSRSAFTDLSLFSNYVSESFDNGFHCCLRINTDIAKAFNRVHHATLITILSDFGLGCVLILWIVVFEGQATICFSEFRFENHNIGSSTGSSSWSPPVPNLYQ